MTEWTEILGAIGRRWPVTRSQLDSVLIALELEGRRQTLVVESLARGPVPAVGVMAEVCALRHIDPIDALRWNVTADGGVLAVYRDVYVVRRILPLERLTADRLDEAMLAAALEAARWARAALPRPVSAEQSHAVFAHLMH